MDWKPGSKHLGTSSEHEMSDSHIVDEPINWLFKWSVPAFVAILLLSRYTLSRHPNNVSMVTAEEHYPPPASSDETTIGAASSAESGKEIFQKWSKVLAAAFPILAVVIVHVCFDWRIVFGGFWNFLTLEYPEKLLGPSAVTIASVIALAGFMQKRKADRKAEWWKRTQYAIDNLISGTDASVVVGNRMIEHLSLEQSGGPFSKSLADRQDKALFASITSKLNEEVRQKRSSGRLGNKPESEEA